MRKAKNKEYPENIEYYEGKPYYKGVRSNMFILEEDINKWIIPFKGKSEDLTGKTFDDLHTVGYVGYRRKQPTYLFRCSCGRYTLKPKKYLKKYTSKKCCSYCSREVFKKSNTKWTLEVIADRIKSKVPERFSWIKKEDGRFGEQTFKCNNCLVEITTTAQNICKKQEGLSCACPESKGVLQGWTKEAREYQINNICTEKNYTFIRFLEGCSAEDHVEIQCNRDGHRWRPTINGFTRGTECPKCREDLEGKYLTIKNTEWYLDKYGAKPNIDYSKTVCNGANNKTTFICTIHGEYLQCPYDHWKSRTGCPLCSSGGFKTDKSAILYINLVDNSFLKIGISNRDPHIRKLSQQRLSGLEVVNLNQFTFTLGKDALNIEQELRQRYECGIVQKEEFPDGYTETFHVEDYDSILMDVNRFCRAIDEAGKIE